MNWQREIALLYAPRGAFTVNKLGSIYISHLSLKYAFVLKAFETCRRIFSLSYFETFQSRAAVLQTAVMATEQKHFLR